MNNKLAVPKAFVWRRLHSLMGLLIVVYLMEHLIVNSQAALWIGEDGIGFIRLVNLINSIPYLQIIEILLIGIPIFFHGILGIKYALTSKGNVRSYSGVKPCLKYERNIAFSWQRITSWILIIGIIVHVVHMRFLEKPKKIEYANQEKFFVKLNFDSGLYTLSDRLNVSLYDANQVNTLHTSKISPLNQWTSSKSVKYDPTVAMQKAAIQKDLEKQKWIDTLRSFSLNNTQVVAASDSIGTAFLLMVRNAFKNPIWSIFYSLFVISAVYHAFNGIWTAMITWGVILSYRSQKVMVNIVMALMMAIGLLGLITIWGSYWINLRS